MITEINLGQYYLRKKEIEEAFGAGNNNAAAIKAAIDAKPNLGTTAQTAAKGDHTHSNYLTSHNPVDSTLLSDSTNAVENRAIYNALRDKSNNGHTHNYLPNNADGSTTGTLTAKKFISSSNNNDKILLGNGSAISQSTFAENSHTHNYALSSHSHTSDEVMEDASHVSNIISSDTEVSQKKINSAINSKMSDTGWVNFPFNTMNATMNSLDDYPRIRKIGKIVIFTGIGCLNKKVSPNGSLTIGTLSEKYRPSIQVSIPWTGINGRLGYIRVYPNGNVQLNVRNGLSTGMDLNEYFIINGSWAVD